MDTTGKQPISEATISVKDLADSSLVTFTLTNKSGVFEVKGLATGKYELIISHPEFYILWTLLQYQDQLLSKNRIQQPAF